MFGEQACRAVASRTFLAALVWLSVTVPRAEADAVSDFYRGKTLSLIIGTSAGNDYDFRGRLIARHIGRHIPGEPAIVPRNMPGAGGVNAANWLANIAPRDGTTLHAIMTNMMAAQAIGTHGVQFDTRKFRWIGNTTSSPNVTNSWHASGITSIEQTKTRELVLGAPAGTAGVTYGTVMNALVGTKFKIVTGYPGGNEVNLAMERGEVEGRGSNSWASWKSTKPEWLAQKKIIALVQVGLTRDPELPDVPLLFELVSNELDRKVMTFLSAETAISRTDHHGRRADGTGRGPAPRLRRHHEGPAIPGRGREGENGHQSDERRGVAEDRRLDRQHAARRGRSRQGDLG